MQAATLKAWSSWGALPGKDRKRITRRAFDLRRRITRGEPVGEDDRAMLERYERDPERAQKRRTLATPVLHPLPSSPVQTSGEDTAPRAAPEPVDASMPLPPLAVGVEDEKPNAEVARASRAQVEQQARYVYEMVRKRNAENRLAGKLAWPDEMIDLLVYPAALDVAERRGGLLKMTPKVADAVLGVAVGSVMVAAMMPAKVATSPGPKPAPDTTPHTVDAAPAPAPEPAPEGPIIPAPHVYVSDEDSPV